MVDTVVTLYPLDFGKGSLALSAARYAHTFATSSYSSTKSIKDANGSGGLIRRDLLVIGCRKKVVLYGAGKTFKDPWVGLVMSPALTDRNYPCSTHHGQSFSLRRPAQLLPFQKRSIYYSHPPLPSSCTSIPPLLSVYPSPSSAHHHLHQLMEPHDRQITRQAQARAR